MGQIVLFTMGGTATAINLALKHEIPVRNLYKEEDRKFIEEFVERNTRHNKLKYWMHYRDRGRRMLF